MHLAPFHIQITRGLAGQLHAHADSAHRDVEHGALKLKLRRQIGSGGVLSLCDSRDVQEDILERTYSKV